MQRYCDSSGSNFWLEEFRNAILQVSKLLFALEPLLYCAFLAYWPIGKVTKHRINMKDKDIYFTFYILVNKCLANCCYTFSNTVRYNFSPI